MTHWKFARSVLVATGMVMCIAGASAADLDGPASIVFDEFRVPTVVATTEHDAIYLQGYMHARDRFWQMDFQRRLFSGKVSELVGSSAIPQDVQLRTLGLRRAAERSMAVQTPEVLAWLDAYSDGVNAFLSDPSNPLPIEYGALEIDRGGIPPWTPLDSLTMAKGLAFGLSFDLGDIDNTLALLNFRGVGEVLGFNGLQLYTNDLYRTAPFDPTVSIPGAFDGEEGSAPDPPGSEEIPPYLGNPDFGTLVQSYRDAVAEVPILASALEADHSETGSNWWVASGALTASGSPMIANDPHLALGTPATFYEIHLYVEGELNVTGISFAGAPGLVQGCNDEICWGSTVNPLDVTDVYNEVLQALDPSQPTTPTHTTFRGVPEPLQFIPQTFLFNVVGDGVPNNLFNAGVPATQGGVTLIVPRRNNGPIVNVSFNPASPTPLTGLSVQYTGWSATQELETFRRFARAKSMQEFKDALQFFDVGSQNWVYADINGNIAYYTSAELPIRQDLQTLFFPAGLITPAIIRDGTGTSPHEWLPVLHPQPHQAVGYEILPFAEMPQIENPASGYILNANNDPIGTSLDNVAWNQFRAGFNGLLYLSSSYASGYRIGRLQRLFDEAAAAGPLSIEQFADWQANNQLLDAEVLTPFLLDAFDNASAPGAAPELTALIADPRIGDAIGRLASWGFDTPTGIDQGYDPGDDPSAVGPPNLPEIDASVASTIYAVWRGQVTQRVVDDTLNNLPVPLGSFAPGSAQVMTALRNLLDRYPVNGGTGASLINFFNVPGVPDQAVARDVVLLESLRDALDLLASASFAPAFANSTNLDDYRWGKLHRIVFAHPLGGPFSVPAAGAPDNVAPDLPGYARAGGMGALDASSHSSRADGLNEFMFGSGPARRFLATMTPDGPDAVQVIPGGESGNLGYPNRTDQLGLWLVNDYHPLPVALDDVLAIAVDTETYECGDGVVGPGEECDDGNANNADGCKDNCRLAPTIACQSPVVSADPQTCDAAIACDVIATCTDGAGAAIVTSCDPAGPYGQGTSSVAVSCSDGRETAYGPCEATVVDTTPPDLAVSLSPDDLWPPNHRMVEVVADVTALDACGPTSVVLESVVSNEPDDEPGNGDGNTADDVQQADVGTADFLIDLRAERNGDGDGREYTVSYTATDGSGNQTTATGIVTVAHDKGNGTEPLMVTLGMDVAGARVQWTDTQEATTLSYNVIRGNLADIRTQGSEIRLGAVTCIEADSLDLSTSGLEDGENPAPGQAYFYLVESDDGWSSSYSTESAGMPRVPESGGCE